MRHCQFRACLFQPALPVRPSRTVGHLLSALYLLPGPNKFPGEAMYLSLRIQVQCYPECGRSSSSTISC